MVTPESARSALATLLAEPRHGRAADHLMAQSIAPSPVHPPVSGRGVLLCHTPRSGSWWLSSLMAATGVLGDPREHLHPGRAPTVPAADLADRMREAAYRGRSPEGEVFSMKVSFTQLAPYLRTGAFPGPWTWDVVYLSREDLVLQGVSYHRAETTRSWRSDQEPTTEAVFDAAAIWARVAELAGMMSAWETTFAALGMAPLRLTYEQVERDPEAALRAIATHVGVTLPSDLVLDSPWRRQRTDESEAWAARLVPGRG